MCLIEPPVCCAPSTVDGPCRAPWQGRGVATAQRRPMFSVDACCALRILLYHVYIVHYLDFKGRVTEVSSKNCQLVHWDHNSNRLGTDLVLLFGKKGHGEYALDFSYPMTPLQAFALGGSGSALDAMQPLA